MYRISVRAIEALAFLDADRRSLLEKHRRTDWEAVNIPRERRERIAGIVSRIEGTADLAVYRLLHETDGRTFERVTVAPRNPMMSVGAEAAVEGASVVFRDMADGTSIELHIAAAVVPFDWDEYWHGGA